MEIAIDRRANKGKDKEKVKARGSRKVMDREGRDWSASKVDLN